MRNTITTKWDCNTIHMLMTEKRLLCTNEHKWNDSMASLFIQSLLIGMPVMPIFTQLMPDTEGSTRHTVIDGNQRCDAILKFMNGKLTLTGLKQYHTVNMNGWTYNSIPNAMQTYFNESKIPFFHVSDDIEHEEITDLKERLNTHYQDLSKCFILK